MKKKYIEDIEFLINKLEVLHPCLYFNINKEYIDKMIEQFKNSNNQVNDYQFFYFISFLLKQLNDSHTYCFLPTKIFPFKLKIIENKVYIIESSKEYSKYKFFEIIAINNIHISMIMKELEKIISYSTNGWLEKELENELLSSSIILSLPTMINSDEEISYTLEKDGISEVLKLSTEKKYNYDFIDTRNYWFEYNQDDNILIIKYKNCHQEEKKTMLAFVKEIQIFIRDHNINNIIVDIRDNAGGDSSVINPLIKYLKNGNFNITTLVDKGVFSSGVFALIDLKHIGSNFVGTQIGTQINHFGHSNHFVLPNSNINVGCSTKYWYCKENKMRGIDKIHFHQFYKKNIKCFISDIFLPDINIENKIEDYKNGCDKQLMIALENISNKRSLI